MPKVYFISDTHFGEPEIFHSSGEAKNFHNASQKDLALIANWNNIVEENDIVFILGDFGKPHYAKLLSGHKILVKGNHDIYSKCEYESYFEEALNYSIIYENFFILSHGPMWVDEDGPYANIFGHVHNNPIYKTVSSRSYCVCACRNNWAPVEFDTIRSAMINE